MCKNLLLIVAIILSWLGGFSQESFIQEKDYKMFFEHQVTVTPDRGWIILGGKEFSSQNVTVLSKFEKCGNLLWAKEYDVFNDYQNNGP